MWRDQGMEHALGATQAIRWRGSASIPIVALLPLESGARVAVRKARCTLATPPHSPVPATGHVGTAPGERAIPRLIRNLGRHLSCTT